MKKTSDPLLDEVLDEATPPDFRESTLALTLHGARRRRLFRRCQNAAALAGLFAAAVAVHRYQSTPVLPTAPEARPDLVIIHSLPLAPSLVVHTQPDTVSVVTSSVASYALVETRTHQQEFRNLNDDELLAIFAGKPVGLVRNGPHQVELIFLNPEDQKGFRVQ